jgi:hypothetical protein
MKCERARGEIALLVGGDLPERRVPKLLAHFKMCPDCAAELQHFRQTRDVIADLAGVDTPQPLPADFSARVHRQLAAEHAEKPRMAYRRFGGRRWRLVAGLAAVIVVILAVSQLVDFRGDDSRPVAGWEKMKREFGESVQDPVELDSWIASGQPGVYVVLHKPDPKNQPEVYRFDYCGEAAKLVTFTGSPWNRQRERRLLARAGSRDNIYIAVLSLPESTTRERREIKRMLIEEFNPFFNRKNGV